MSDIRRLPAVEDRVETGPVQFGEDWPGFFIRGDHAFALRIALGVALISPHDPLSRAQVRAFMQSLDECNVNERLVAKLREGDNA